MKCRAARKASIMIADGLGNQMRKPQILLVEDDEALREEMSTMLRRRNHDVYDCGTIAEALTALQRRSHDVVVTDINLPDGDGVSFCLTHAGQTPNTRWLLMSGDAQRLSASRQLVRGPDAPPFSVLEKPVPIQQLVDFVRLAMAQREGVR
jgi:DNA-binding NtrC family response regulator